MSWDAERLAKVERNYAMEYVRSLLPELCAVLGPADAGHVGRIAGRQIGMQYADTVAALLAGGDRATPATGPASFVRLLARLAAGQGDRVEVETASETGSVGVDLDSTPTGAEPNRSRRRLPASRAIDSARAISSTTSPLPGSRRPS